jgi:hypothetical protein
MIENNPIPTIAPTVSDLAQAYSDADPALGRQRQAEAVLTGPQGITLLTTETRPDGEQTALIWLTDGGDVAQERRYEAVHGAGRSFAKRDDGGFVIAGDLRRSVMEYQGHLLQVDQAGTVVAERAIGPLGLTGLVCVVVLADGVTVAGGTTNWKGWLVRVDTASQSDISLPDLNDVFGLAVRPRGGFAAACVFDGSTTGLGRASVMAWSADGAADWRADLPSPGRGELTGLASLPDGGLAAVGHHVTEDQVKARLWVVRLDSGGAVLWQRSLGPADVEQRGRAIAVLADGGIAAAGDFVKDNLRRAHVARLDPGGGVLWEQSLGAADRYTVARGIAPTPGGVVLAGSTRRGGGKTEAWIIGLDADGRQQWERKLPADP